MLRRFLFNIFALEGLGLAIGAYAETTAIQATTLSTVVSATTSLPTTSPPPSTTSTISTTSTASTTQTTTPTIRSDRWCPWCHHFDTAANASYCNIVVRQPESTDKVWSYPVMIFNHDFSDLVQTETILTTEPAYKWSFAPPGSPWNFVESLHVVFVPSLKSNNTDQMPKIIYNDGHDTHDQGWLVVPKAGEVAPGIQSSLFHSSFICRR